MNKIYLLYHSLFQGVPSLNWLPAHIEMDGTELHEGLCHDPLFEFKDISKVASQDNWLYELNYFFTPQDFTDDCTILDRIVHDQKLMEGLHQGKGKVLVNLMHEGYFPELVEQMIGFLRSKNIPDNAVICASGAANAADIFPARGMIYQTISTRYFESRSTRWIKWGNFSSQPRSNVSRRFICFNRRFRSHRLQLLAYLHEADVLDQFYISFGRSVEGLDAKQSARDFCRDLPDVEKVIKNIDALYDRLPFILDNSVLDYNLVDEHFNKNVLQLYADSGISVISETLFHTDSIFHSEKTYHPMRYCQPFIMVNASGSLATLRRDGYRTFGDFWDESYDDIKDHHARMQAIIQLIKEIAAWSDSKFKQFLIDSREICLHNLRLLESCHDRLDYIADISKIFD